MFWGVARPLPASTLHRVLCAVSLSPSRLLFATARTMSSVPAPAAAPSKLHRLDPATTVFFACDIQEVFRPRILEFPSLLSNTKTLLEAAAALGSPVVVTEQYPKALGHTVAELAPLITGVPTVTVHEKTLFSMLTPEVRARTSAAGMTAAVVFGLEAHVCVLNSALDLLRDGVPVYVVVDAVSSQRAFDRTVAIERLRSVGALLTTVESLLFELIQDKGHPRFKEISTLAKALGAPTTPTGLSHL